jgi:beta-glucosidase
VVQLYVRDRVGSVTRPVKELKGFQRITLRPGEERTVRFDVPAGELGFIGMDMRYAVEPGAFKVWVGPDSTTGLEGHFERLSFTTTTSFIMPSLFMRTDATCSPGTSA